MVADPRARLNRDRTARLTPPDPVLRPGSPRPGSLRSGSPQPLPSRSALDLLGQARAGLAEAAGLDPAGERYAGAHLAALRGAAAVLAARVHPPTDPQQRAQRRRLRSAWDLLCEMAPEMAEWAVFFAAGAAKRAAAEAGVRWAVNAREADDLVRDVETFLAVVATTIGAVPTVAAVPTIGAAVSGAAVSGAAVTAVGCEATIGPRAGTRAVGGSVGGSVGVRAG